MANGSFRFECYDLDPGNRRLSHNGVPLELNGRYLDALTLLVHKAGQLVSKDHFMEEVWRGVPVTDEALTQCIRTLRRLLADDAARPRFIETVPKYSYRFIAPVEQVLGPAASIEARSFEQSAAAFGWRDVFALGGAGTVGAAMAGGVGGIFYGSVGASGDLSGTGGASVFLVMLWLTIVAATVGGAGVSFGIAAAGFARTPICRIAGGAAGGFFVGGIAKLLGIDAFNLLLGRSPAGITGAFEGLFLGGAVGTGSWLASRHVASNVLRRKAGIAALAGGAGAGLAVLLGGRLMGGSLDLLATTFPSSRLRLDRLGHSFGESHFGQAAQYTTGLMEGALFGACGVGAMSMVRRRFGNAANSPPAARPQQQVSATAD